MHCRAGVGSTFLDATPWTFVTALPVRVTVTDAFLAGDFFDVFDSGSAIGSTPAVLVNGGGRGLDPSVCVLNPDVSHGTFLLAGGVHSLTIDVHAMQVLGEGFLRVDAVPEPATFALMLLVCLVGFGYRGYGELVVGRPLSR